MLTQGKTNLSHAHNTLSEYIPAWANAFYRAKKAEGISSYTQVFYNRQLGHFLVFFQGKVIEQVSQITPTAIRQEPFWPKEDGLYLGGQHTADRRRQRKLLALRESPARGRPPIRLCSLNWFQSQTIKPA
jgi:hypothetical protein